MTNTVLKLGITLEIVNGCNAMDSLRQLRLTNPLHFFIKAFIYAFPIAFML